MNSVGLVDDPLCELHVQNNYEHPERPDRIRVIRDKLKTSGIYNCLVHIPAKIASDDELCTVHEQNYLRHVEDIARNGGFVSGSPDVSLRSDPNSNSLVAAKTAAGGVIEGTKAVVNGVCKYVYCNVRPPGHHAYSTRGGGFCIYNNVALGVEEALKTMKRALVFDWDVHHGNGTESIFENRNDVMYASIHRGDKYGTFYPGTGYTSNEFTLNFPLNGGVGIEEYKSTFENDFLPRAKEFDPDIIFISCGIDAHRLDNIGGNFPLTEEDYRWMVKHFKSFNKPIVCVLEGGYNLDALANTINAIVLELLLNE